MLPRPQGMWWGTAIEAPDPSALAAFYSALLGWTVGHEEAGTAIVTAPGGLTYIVFQEAVDYERPVWPPAGGRQRPMMHFDFQVADLDGAVAEAVALGATLAEYQPQRARAGADRPGRPSVLRLSRPGVTTHVRGSGTGRGSRRPTVSQVTAVSCHLCGIDLGEADDVVEVGERLVHAACAQSAHIPVARWRHLDRRALNDVARSAGWTSSIGG